MQTPSITTRSDVLYSRYGTYHFQRMSALEGLKPLAEQFEQSQQALRSQQEALRQAILSETGARAVRDARETELMDAVRIFASQLKLLVHQTTDGASYVRYFPNRGVSDVLYLPREKRLDRIKALLSVLADEASPTVLEIAEKLKASYARYAAAATAQEAAAEARKAARAREKSARLSWLASYRSSHAELVKVFSATNPSKADEFFAPVRQRSSDLEEETEVDDDDDLGAGEIDSGSGSSGGVVGGGSGSAGDSVGAGSGSSGAAVGGGSGSSGGAVGSGSGSSGAIVEISTPEIPENGVPPAGKTP